MCRREEHTCLNWPHERVALGDQCPAGRKREQTDTLVAVTSSKEVPHERVSAIVYHADDRDGGEEREWILRDPLPEKDDGKHYPEISALLVVEQAAEVQRL